MSLLSQPLRPFAVFKYSVFLLLGMNIFAFMFREWDASAHTWGAEATIADLISVFAATIDTAAWVVLLLLFEFETSWVPRLRRVPRKLWLVHWVRVICYLLITYAFYGYAVRCLALYDVVPITGVPLCDQVPERPSFLVELDVLATVTEQNCAELGAGGGLVQVTGIQGNVISSMDVLAEARPLAWTDVINAGLWILVVLMLELDLRLKAKHHLGGTTGLGVRGFTALLYLGLLSCDIYWAMEGTFLDFWDAFLWLLAFAAIEMNVFRVGAAMRS